MRSNLFEIAKFMLSLKHLTRSLNGITVLSVRKDTCLPHIWNYIVAQSDIVIEFKPFNGILDMRDL